MEKNRDIQDLMEQVRVRSDLIAKLVKYIETLESDIVASGTATPEALASVYQQIMQGGSDAADTDESE